MSIPRLDSESASGFAGPESESPETAIIKKLAAEFFAGRTPPTGSPSGFPSVHEEPVTTKFPEPSAAPSLPAAEPLSAASPAAVVPPAPSAVTLPGGEVTPRVGDAPATPFVVPPVHEPTVNEPTSAETPSQFAQDDFAFGAPSGKCLLPDGARKSGTGCPSSFEDATPSYYFVNQSDILGSHPAAGAPKSPTPISAFDVAAVRADFPALHQEVNGHPLIFLDNAATTQKPQAVIDATSHFYARDNSNIHRAAYALAERATAAFENGREKVRQFLGAADKHEIIFVRGTTEGINLVAQTYGRKHIGQGDEIILTELEHHANIVPWQLLAEQTGAVIKVIPINDRGELILDEFVRLLGPKTKIVSVAHVSNSLGTVNPVEAIIQIAHGRGVPVLVDGAQSTPHLPVNVQALDADFYVFSGHKVFGPTGIGAVYGKTQWLETLPPYQGGGHMIRDVRFEKTVFQHPPEKFEAGTPDIAGVVGLGAAIDYLFKVGIPSIAAYEHSLLEYATSALATVPGIQPIGTATNKASVLSFVIPGIPNENIAKHLDRHGIAVRAGHHCALPAIRHFGLESSVRPSLAFYNTREDVDTLVSVLHRLPRK